MAEKKSTGLELLRKPFEAHQIGKLPKPTKRQTEIVKQDFKKGIRCDLCGAWHHPDVVHLDYVGHAALTDRLLDCDPEWNWEPTAWTENGQPARDENGGMWIKLTVCGVTRLGYGDAGGKRGGDANKELIGDALRNAAMRFGAALDLWHKGDLHISDDHDEAVVERKPEPKSDNQKLDPAALFDYLKDSLFAADDLENWKVTQKQNLANLRNADKAKFDNLMDLGKKRAGTLAQAPTEKPLVDDEVPF